MSISHKGIQIYLWEIEYAGFLFWKYLVRKKWNNMAAVKKINKEGILEAAYNLARREGIAAITARKLAKEISCSTQPIYENFVDMGAIIEITTDRINEVYGSLRSNLRKKENADYVRQTIIVCEFAGSEKVLFRQLVADNDSGRSLLKDTRTVQMLIDTLHCDEKAADQINEEMHKYIMGQAFLVNEGYTEFDQTRLTEETERFFEFIKKIFVK